MDQNLQSVEAMPRRRSRSRFKRFRKRIARLVNWRLVGIGVVTLLTVLVVGGLVLATDATNRMNSSITNLSRVIATVQSRPGTELTLDDFERLKGSVNDLLNTLNVVRGQTSFLRPLASMNADMATTLSALDITEQLAAAVQEVLTSTEPTLNLLLAGDDETTSAIRLSAGERAVELLRLGRAGFLSAQSRLQGVDSALDQLSLVGISPDMLLNVLALRRYHDQFAAINDSLLLAPDVLQVALGLDSDQTYLVLSQNSDEIRPSGGYVSTYGWLSVRNGRIVDYDYSPTTATSPNPPSIPSPYFVPSWWIQYAEPIYAAWDGSWYADFQRTAEMAAWYYNTGNNPQSPVVGAFGIDLYAVEQILDVIGSVPMADYDVVVSRDNLRQLVYDIRAFGGNEGEHKRFVAALYREIFGQWQTISEDQEKGAALLGVLLQALQQRHLMLHFTDTRLNQFVDNLGWSGRQAAGLTQDYLLVADANLGNKSNRSVIRQITYDVAVDADGRMDGRATIAYDYPASLADADPAVDPLFHGPIDYETLLQVFTPVGTVVTDVQGLTNQISAVAEAEHTILVTQTQVQYDSGARLQFFYSVPGMIETMGDYRRYRLVAQKQPGMGPELLNIQVSLPPGAAIIQTVPEADASYDLGRPIVEFRVEMLTDLTFEVIYRPG